MKRHIQITFIVLILATQILACGISSPSTTIPSAGASQQPAFIGLWMSETETLVFTETSLYRVSSNAELGQVNEQFAEIIAVDPLNNHITVRTQWIKGNGRSVGFDAPTYTLTYQINGDSLQIGRGTETEFASELDPIIYQRK